MKVNLTLFYLLLSTITSKCIDYGTATNSQNSHFLFSVVVGVVLSCDIIPEFSSYWPSSCMSLGLLNAQALYYTGSKLCAFSVHKELSAVR